MTAALSTADDESIVELVSERRALREELDAMREASAGVVRLGLAQDGCGPRRRQVRPQAWERGRVAAGTPSG
ncbi:MAG TPA: hypothetical protein VKU41_09165 [Polyangiaceae bacterium]|nr:hypothetical protein [Polyangiaceae bacterium]